MEGLAFFGALAVSRGEYCDRTDKKADNCFAELRSLVVGGCNRQQQQQQLDRNSDSCLDGFNSGLAEIHAILMESHAILVLFWVQSHFALLMSPFDALYIILIDYT